MPPCWFHDYPMKRLVWISIICAAAACTGGPPQARSSAPQPRASKTVTQPTKPDAEGPAASHNMGGGVVATVCKRRHPITTWDDRESKFGFCERLGYQLAGCWIKSKAKEGCEMLWEQEEQRVDIASSCMKQDFDVADVPEMIETLRTCACGPRRSPDDISCVLADCEDRLQCIVRAGFKW